MAHALLQLTTLPSLCLANTWRFDGSTTTDPIFPFVSGMAHGFLQLTTLPLKIGQFNGSTKTTLPSLSKTKKMSSSSLRVSRQANSFNFSLQQNQHTPTATGRLWRKSRMTPRAISERFTEKAINAVILSQEEAGRLGHDFVGTGQILLGIIAEGTGLAAKALKAIGINLNDARVELENLIGRGSGSTAVEIAFSPRAKHVLELSLLEARQLGHDYIAPEHLLLALLREGEGEGVAVHVLENLGASLNNVRTKVISMIGGKKEPALVTVGIGVSSSNETPTVGIGGSSSNNSPTVSGGRSSSNKTPTISGGNKTPTLELSPTLKLYGTDLTKLAEEGKLHPFSGRCEQIERVTQILGRRTKNTPCLIGEPGVGKTAVVEGLAQRIASGDAPETMEGKKVISLDMGLLVAGTRYRGDFEGRLEKLMEEIRKRDDIILFIDEVHTLIGAGATKTALDAANILKPAFARGELRCIGATTLDEYRQHIEKDPALERRFQPVKVPEPTVAESIEILKGLRQRYEMHHKLRYTDEALAAAAQLSHQYISGRFLPDKAIDLIDEAGSRVRLKRRPLPEEAKELEKEIRQIMTEKHEAARNENYEKAIELRDRETDLKAEMSALVESNEAESEAIVNEVDIQHIVSAWTGIPVHNVSTDESHRLLKMEETLHTRVVGQDEAVTAISRAIRRARVGLKSPNRPIASFIFSGPTGVGKTELAKTLANYYFGSEEAMVRLDMSEFMERNTASRLIGSPPGYVGYDEGGQLTEAVRRRPYTLVLFDEIEKAHPDVFNVMLQILEDGRLTDGRGRRVEFKNTLLIMTSNIGSNVIENDYNRIKSLVTEELKRCFRPEFLNRLDEMIVFRQLTKAEVKEVGDIMVKEVLERLEARGIEVKVTEQFRDRVVQEGYDPRYGARPLRRAITRLLEDGMAEKMLAGEIREGDSAIVDVDSDGKVVLRFLDGFLGRSS